MALAWLEFDSADAGQTRFRFDIGTNRYYTYAVGGKEVTERSGVRLLDQPSFRSSLVGPLPDRARGRGFLDIPSDVLDREHRYVQLMSFRTAESIGPAISDIVLVPGPLQAGRDWGDLPPVTFAQEATMQMRHTTTTVPFNFRETRYSNAMFLEALTNLLPTLLPTVAPMIGSLLGGLTGGSGGSSTPAAGAAPNPTDLFNVLIRQLGNRDFVNQLTQLLTQVLNAQSGSTGTAAANGAQAQTSSLVRTNSMARAQSARSAYASARGQYSEAMVFPVAALISALPALAPVLQQVLKPETIQAVLQAPAQHLGTIFNGLKDFAKLGLESHEQDLAHLRALNPGVRDEDLNNLLMSLSLGLSQTKQEINYKRVAAVQLQFAGVQAQTMYAKTKLPYRYGQALAFPIDVTTPQPIGRALVQLVVKHPDTLEILHQHKEPVEQVTSGRLSVVPTLSLEQAQALEPNRDYLICVTLVWKNKADQKRGTSIQQKITVVGDYSFDRVEESGELIPLSDATRYRDYWHKVWEGTFSDELKRIEFDCKYYYVLNTRRPSNARIETKVRLPAPEYRKTAGQLKSGLELSPETLNQLIPQLAPGRQPLTESELMALRAPDFAERFNQAARYQAKLHGRTGDGAALWVYPEMKLQRVVLQKVGQVNEYGHVLDFTEQVVDFPLPALVHFIGVTTA